MSETRRPDPLRRAPPTIDLKAAEVPREAKASDVASDVTNDLPRAEEGASAIEPVAATGLGPDPFPRSAESKRTDERPGVGSTAGEVTKPPAAEERKAESGKKPTASPASTGASKPDPSLASRPATPVSTPKPAGPASVAASAPAATDKPISTAPAGDAGPRLAGKAGPAPAATGPATRVGETPKPPAKDVAASASAGSRTVAASAASASGSSKPGTSSSAATTAPVSPATRASAADAAAATSATGDVKPTGSPATAPKPAPVSRPEKPGEPSATIRPAAKSGIGPALAAGLLAGLLGSAIAAWAIQAFWPPRPDPALASRLASLEQRVGALPTGNPAAGLETRIAALETALKQAADDVRAARMAAEAAAKTPPAQGTDPATRQALDALGARVDDGARQAGANTAAVADLGTRLGDVGQRVSELATRTGEIGTRVAETGTRVGDLGGKLDALATRSGEGLAAGVAAIGALKSGLGDVQSGLGALKTGSAALEARAGTAEGRIADLSGTLARVTADLGRLSPAAVQAGLRIVVAGRLDEAMRSGAPLGPELGALGRLGVEAAALAPLQPFAEAGAPSAGTLAVEFKPISAQLTAVAPSPDESVGDKLRRLAGKVVTVRAVGDGSGSDVPGLVGRIEAALGRGALADAAAAWEQLPEGAKRSSAAWGGKLKARVAAEDAARRIGTGFLAALDAATR